MVAYYENRVKAVGCGLRLLAFVLLISAAYLLLRFGLQARAVLPLMLAVLAVWLLKTSFVLIRNARSGLPGTSLECLRQEHNACPKGRNRCACNCHLKKNHGANRA